MLYKIQAGAPLAMPNSFNVSATACTAMPSSRPVKPSFSDVVAFGAENSTMGPAVAAAAPDRVKPA